MSGHPVTVVTIDSYCFLYFAFFLFLCFFNL